MTLRDAFVHGAIMALLFGATCHFARFRQVTGDWFFTPFAAAFGLLCLNQVAFLVFGSEDPSRPELYVVRLLAFCLILGAIVVKNVRGR